MSRPPAFQFYPRDFLTDPAVVLMTPEERGGYVLLLCHAWLSKDAGILADDDHVLATLSGLSEERWKVCRARIGQAFIQRDGKWIQKRLSQERKEQQERSEKMRRTANSRWDKKPDAMLEPCDPAMHTQCSASASSSASKDLESKDQTKTSFGVGTVSGAEPVAAVSGDPTPNPTPVGDFSLSRFEPQKQTGSDPEAVHRLVAAGVDSLLADQLVAKEAEARRRIGGGA